MAFKVADGYVEIHVRYERGKLNKAAETAGGDAGSRFSSQFRRNAERDLSKNFFGKRFMQREAGQAGQAAGRSFSQRFKDVTGKTLNRDITVIEKTTVKRTRDMGRRLGKSVADGVGSTMTEGLKKWWNSSMDLTKGHLVMIAGAVAAFAPTIGATLATGITLAFGAGIAGLGIYAALQVKEVKQAFRDLGTDVGRDFVKMSKPIQSALIRVTDQAWDLHKNLKSSFSSAFEDVAATLDETTPRIVAGFSSWGPVIQTASKAFRNLMKATDFEKIVDDLGGAFGRLFQVVRDNPDSFAGIIEGAASLVTGLIDLTTWLADTYVKFEEDLGPAVDDFEASMSPLVDLLQKFAEEVGPIASQAIEDMISSFGDAQDVKDAKNEIDGTKSAIESITGWFVKADNGFRKFSEAWFGSADKIRESDGMKSVRQWFKDFGSYLGDVGMVFVDWGKKIWGGLKQIGSSFVSVGKVIWNAMSYVFYEPGIDGMIVGAITWIGEWIWKGLKKIGDAFYWLYDYLVGHSVVPDMVNGIVLWISSLPGKVIGFIWGMVTKVASFFNDMALKTLATISGWVPQLGAAMTAIYTTITGWILSAVNKVKSWFTSMKNNTVATVTGWATALTAKFTAIRDGVKARINSLVNSVKERFTNMKNSTVATVTGWWTSLAAKFNSIRDGARSRINSLVASVKERFTNMKNTVNKTVSGWVSDVRSKFSNLREKVVSTAKSTRNSIVDVWNDMKKKAIKAFTGMKDGIKEVWNKVKKVARDPVKFMAHTVYNDGIVAVYRKIRSIVPALPELKKIQLGKEWFAKGGIMPGYTPGRDVHTVPGPRGAVGLSGGEAIMRPEWTKAVGPEFVHGMNALARKRGTLGVKQALTPDPQTVHQVKELGKKATATRDPSPMGYAKGGILGKVNEFVGKAKSKLADGFMSFATPALNGLTDGLKDRFGKGPLPNVPYHLMSSVIIPKMLSFLQEKEDEEIGGGTGTAADVVSLAKKSVGKYPESGGNNTNAITRWFGMNGAPWCLVAGTLVRTPQGQIPIEDLQVGDEVYAGNQSIQKVEVLYRRTKPVYELKALGVVPTQITYDHPVMTPEGYVKAGELKRGDFIAKPIPVTGDIQVNEDFARMVGLYVAEGYRGHRDSCVTFCVSHGEAESVSSLVKSAGYDPRVAHHHTCSLVTVYDRELYELLGEAGDGADAKTVPGFVLSWDESGRRAFVEGYVSGDGHRPSSRPGVVACTTVSKKLAVTLPDLLSTLGISAAARQTKGDRTEVIEGREVSCKSQYVVEYREHPPLRAQHRFDVKRGILWVPVRSVEPLGFEETVYDIQVSEEHSFIANGVYVSNCAMFISWLFDKAGASPALKKAKRTAWTGDYYTSGMKRVAQDARKPGDVAVYGVDHVNLVENKKYRIGGNEGNNVSRSQRKGGTIFRPDWSKAGGAGGGSGNTVLTSFWDSHAPMANGKRMHSSAVASSVLPLGTKVRVKVGSKTATGSIDDLGPSSFVYKRHHPKAVLDLAEPMMAKLTGRRSNVVNGSFTVTKRGTGRTLFGYTNWSGKYNPGRSTKGFADGGIMSGSHDIGGLLPDKGIAYNRTGSTEVIQTMDQLQALLKAAERGTVIHVDKICIDAKNVKEFQDVVDMVKNVKTTSRANRGRTSRDGF